MSVIFLYFYSMRLLKQFELLLIDDCEESVYSYPDHAHLYYEMVYIHSGTGVHVMNNRKEAYESGDFFVLSPGDHHYFAIEEQTHFTFIKFTEAYFLKFSSARTLDNEHPLDVMTIKALKEKKLRFSLPFSTVLKNIVENIVVFDASIGSLDSSVLIYHHILSLLSIVRSAFGASIPIKKRAVTHQAVLAYIQRHVYERAALNVASMATVFSIAPSYFSNWFKREFGLGFSDYVCKQRNVLIEQRVLEGNLTLKQIAEEFGFVDESHLIKYFKRNFGTKPSLYKQQQEEVRGEERTILRN